MLDTFGYMLDPALFTVLKWDGNQSFRDDTIVLKITLRKTH